ncbi:hypothetical protein BH09CHL1_BH09CHL1_20020 [soil metagenome]
MQNLPENPPISKLHDALNSLNVTWAYLQLSHRRLLKSERTPSEVQLLESLELAGDRLVVAIGQLREVEAMLGEESGDPGGNEGLRTARANDPPLS